MWFVHDEYCSSSLPQYPLPTQFLEHYLLQKTRNILQPPNDLLRSIRHLQPQLPLRPIPHNMDPPPILPNRGIPLRSHIHSLSVLELPCLQCLELLGIEDNFTVLSEITALDVALKRRDNDLVARFGAVGIYWVFEIRAVCFDSIVPYLEGFDCSRPGCGHVSI